MRPGSLVRASVVPIVLLAMAACSSRSVERVNVAPSNPEVATSLVIDQFMRATMSYDLDTMARLFGTVDGSILGWESRTEVDQRMFAIASLLRHDSYSIKGLEIVPGRREEATRVIVNMSLGEHSVDVPYTLVWSKNRTWMIEQIDLEAFTRR